MTSNEKELNTGWHNDPDDEIPFGGRDEEPSPQQGDEVTIEEIPDDLPTFDPKQAPMELGKPVNGPVNLDEVEAKTLAYNERHIRWRVADAIAEAAKEHWFHPWVHETNQRVRTYVDDKKNKGYLTDEAYKELCDEISNWYATRLGNVAVTDSGPGE